MTPEVRAARERKQKIFVVVGGLFLLVLLAIQLPRLLGGSSTASEAAPPTVPTSGVEQPGAAAPRGAGVALVDSGRSARPAPGKLTSFSVFSQKDPFVQQVDTGSTPTDAGDTGGGTQGGKDGSDGKDGGNGEQKKSATAEFSVDTPADAVTIVSVNRVRQVLEPGAAFPASDPVFVLVAEQPRKKAVVVAIAGGAYASGAKTTTLKVGKPLTLVNTTTGAKYRLVLVAVGSGSGAAKPESTP